MQRRVVVPLSMTPAASRTRLILSASAATHAITVSQLCYTALERPSFWRQQSWPHGFLLDLAAQTVKCTRICMNREPSTLRPSLSRRSIAKSTCWGMDAKVRGSIEVHQIIRGSGIPSRAELRKTDHAFFFQAATTEESQVASAVRTVTAKHV